MISYDQIASDPKRESTFFSLLSVHGPRPVHAPGPIFDLLKFSQLLGALAVTNRKSQTVIPLSRHAKRIQTRQPELLWMSTLVIKLSTMKPNH